MSDKAQVALVNMPFSFSKYPSIQLGTLSQIDRLFTDAEPPPPFADLLHAAQVRLEIARG